MDLSTLQGNIIQFIHFYCFFNLKFFDVKLAKMMKTDMPVFFCPKVHSQYLVYT